LLLERAAGEGKEAAVGGEPAAIRRRVVEWVADAEATTRTELHALSL
jgi:hypothetical protein